MTFVASRGESNVHLNPRVRATLSLLALAFDSPRDELLKAQVAAGAKYTKTFEETRELEGKTVLFAWNGEEELCEPKFEDESGYEALLPGLDEDTDLRAFPPGKPVAEGGSWTVSPGAFDAIFYPGGDVKVEVAHSSSGECKGVSFTIEDTMVFAGTTFFVRAIASAD